MRRSILALLAAGPLALTAVAAQADDRAPTAEERAGVEEALRAQGFTAWEEIEWDDDGYWEVDDAVGPDGDDVELKLDSNFQIIERDD